MNIKQITDFIGVTNSRDLYSKEIEQHTPVGFDAATLGDKEVYYSWQAESRPVQKGFNNRLIRTFTIIGIVVALILVILQEFFLILVIASMIFVSHVLSKTPPETIKYELSSHGLSIEDQLYYWPELQRFFFFEEEGHHYLAIDTTSSMPPRLLITVHSHDQEKIKEILSRKVHFLEKPPESFLDKTYKSMMDKFKL